jgi:hypothetical protein
MRRINEERFSNIKVILSKEAKPDDSHPPPGFWDNTSQVHINDDNREFS